MPPRRQLIHLREFWAGPHLEKLNGQPGVVASATIWLFLSRPKQALDFHVNYRGTAMDSRENGCRKKRLYKLCSCSNAFSVLAIRRGPNRNAGVKIGTWCAPCRSLRT